MSSDQGELFFDTENDALRSCIASAGGMKAVAGKLWPALKPPTAYARLAACLDDGKYEKLTFAEIIKIGKLGRDSGCHALMSYLAAELSYEVRPLSARDELVGALEIFEQKSDELMHAISAVKRAKGRAET